MKDITSDCEKHRIISVNGDPLTYCPICKIEQLKAERDAAQEGRAKSIGQVLRLKEENAQLKAERDAARREVCELIFDNPKCPHLKKESIARKRSWNDLFEERGE